MKEKKKEIPEGCIGRLGLLEKAALLSGGGAWKSRALPRRGLPALFFSDGPHGLRKQEGVGDHLGLNASLPATCFPTAATVANSWDTELAEAVGEALGDTLAHAADLYHELSLVVDPRAHVGQEERHTLLE